MFISPLLYTSTKCFDLKYAQNYIYFITKKRISAIRAEEIFENDGLIYDEERPKLYFSHEV